MYHIKIGDKLLLAEEGELLSRVLQRNGISMPHPCGGTGLCEKCKLLVNGKETLSCQYKIRHDVSVTLPNEEEITTNRATEESHSLTEHMCYVLDIGTTTLVLALVSQGEGKVIRTITKNNPQRAFGADIMSRISYCQAHSQAELHAVLVTAIKDMIVTLGVSQSLSLFVSGNVTMLHLFLNEDCLGLGTVPHTPIFLEGQKIKSFIEGVSEIELLPSIHTFVGADIVAGMYHVGMPQKGKYRLLVDLGTNAEIVLFSREKTLCTAAAAGPCFEGCGICCGMSATDGAICEVGLEGRKLLFKTVQNGEPKGICGTGLIDLVATLLNMGLIDKTGCLEDELYPLTENIYVDASDIRQLQLAKSAVCSAILSLIRMAGISFDDIETLYLSGGFSEKINVQNAATIGLLPKELAPKAVSVGNSSLLGTIKYAKEKDDLSPLLKNAHYIDLAQTPDFSKLFMQNMMF